MAVTLARLIPIIRPSRRKIAVKAIADASYDTGHDEGYEDGYTEGWHDAKRLYGSPAAPVPALARALRSAR